MSAHLSKTERLSLRLAPETKRKLEQAATLTHQSVNAFVLALADQKAEEIIAENQTQTLSDEDRNVFFEAIASPPKPNRALKKAFAAHQSRVRSK